MAALTVDALRADPECLAILRAAICRILADDAPALTTAEPHPGTPLTSQP